MPVPSADLRLSELRSTWLSGAPDVPADPSRCQFAPDDLRLSELRPIRLAEAPDVPADLRRCKVAPFNEIASVSAFIMNHLLCGKDLEMGQFTEHLFNRAKEDVSRSRTIAIICKLLHDNLAEYMGEGEARFFKEFLVTHVATFNLDAWEETPWLCERSWFLESRDTYVAAFTFLADLYAMGLVEPHVFFNWTRRIVDIPYEVDQPHFGIVALTRGISCEGRLIYREHLSVRMSMKEYFNRKRGLEDAAAAFEMEKLYTRISKAFKTPSSRHDGQRCKISFAHVEDSEMSCRSIIDLQRLGIEEVEI